MDGENRKSHEVTCSPSVTSMPSRGHNSAHERQVCEAASIRPSLWGLVCGAKSEKSCLRGQVWEATSARPCLRGHPKPNLSQKNRRNRSTTFFNKSPLRNCTVNGLVLVPFCRAGSGGEGRVVSWGYLGVWSWQPPRHVRSRELPGWDSRCQHSRYAVARVPTRPLFSFPPTEYHSMFEVFLLLLESGVLYYDGFWEAFRKGVVGEREWKGGELTILQRMSMWLWLPTCSDP